MLYVFVLCCIVSLLTTLCWLSFVCVVEYAVLGCSVVVCWEHVLCNGIQVWSVRWDETRFHLLPSWAAPHSTCTLWAGWELRPGLRSAQAWVKLSSIDDAISICVHFVKQWVVLLALALHVQFLSELLDHHFLLSKPHLSTQAIQLTLCVIEQHHIGSEKQRQQRVLQ